MASCRYTAGSEFLPSVVHKKYRPAVVRTCSPTHTCISYMHTITCRRYGWHLVDTKHALNSCLLLFVRFKYRPVAVGTYRPTHTIRLVDYTYVLFVVSFVAM